MSLKERLNKLSELGVRPDDSEDQKVKKASLSVLAIPFAMAGLIWGVIYFILGYITSGLIPFSYGVLSFISYIWFTYSKNYISFRNSQLFLILILPFCLQLSLGGFVPSSAVIMWAFISPMGALMFLSEKMAWRWFYAFLCLLIAAYLLNNWASNSFVLHVPQSIIHTIFLLNFAAVSTIIFSMLNYYVQRQHKLKVQIREEKARSEKLLLNILPEEIAKELKENGQAEAQNLDQVTILFTDVKGFTQISEQLQAHELVAEINHLFKAFDKICEQYHIEKIKTIGDSYMAAGGVPKQSPHSAKHVIQAALEMVEFINQRKVERLASNQIPFEMRLGIHTGNVIAGIVGVKKFQYDIWGDTVNMASRMESSGQVSMVNISEFTYKLVKDDTDLAFTDRGLVEAKGKGQVRMYFVKHA